MFYGSPETNVEVCPYGHIEACSKAKPKTNFRHALRLNKGRFGVVIKGRSEEVSQPSSESKFENIFRFLR
jgi:hypothetical protein